MHSHVLVSSLKDSRKFVAVYDFLRKICDGGARRRFHGCSQGFSFCGTSFFLSAHLEPRKPVLTASKNDTLLSVLVKSHTNAKTLSLVSGN